MATVAIGYGDGLHDDYKTGFQLRVNGVLLPSDWPTCMDQSTVDVDC